MYSLRTNRVHIWTMWSEMMKSITAEHKHNQTPSTLLFSIKLRSCGALSGKAAWLQSVGGFDRKWMCSLSLWIALHVVSPSSSLSEATLADGNYDFLSAFLLPVSPSLKPDLTISLQSSHSFHLSSNRISVREASSAAGFQILDVKMSLAVTSTHRGFWVTQFKADWQDSDLLNRKNPPSVWLLHEFVSIKLNIHNNVTHMRHTCQHPWSLSSLGIEQHSPLFGISPSAPCLHPGEMELQISWRIDVLVALRQPCLRKSHQAAVPEVSLEPNVPWRKKHRKTNLGLPAVIHCDGHTIMWPQWSYGVTWLSGFLCFLCVIVGNCCLCCDCTNQTEM